MKKVILLIGLILLLTSSPLFAAFGQGEFGDIAGGAEWSDDGSTLTTLNAGRNVDIGGDLSVTNDLSAGNGNLYYNSGVNTFDVPTINTGQGDNEVYGMDQNVKTSSNVTFANTVVTDIDTGSGAKELGDAAVTNGDTDSVPTCDQVYDFCETTQAYYNAGDIFSFDSGAVTGDVIISGSLTVTDFFVTSSISMIGGGNIAFNANTAITGTLSTTSDLTVGDSVEIAKNLTVDTNTLVVNSDENVVNIGRINGIYKLDLAHSGGVNVARYQRTDVGSVAVLLQDTIDACYWGLSGANGYQWLGFTNNASGTDFVALSSAGDFGIGDNTPDAKLDVAGDAQFDSDVTIDGDLITSPTDLSINTNLTLTGAQMERVREIQVYGPCIIGLEDYSNISHLGSVDILVRTMGTSGGGHVVSINPDETDRFSLNGVQLATGVQVDSASALGEVAVIRANQNIPGELIIDTATFTEGT